MLLRIKQKFYIYYFCNFKKNKHKNKNLMIRENLVNNSFFFTD